ncbi:MAG TPA: glycosyltransferase family 2 protein, partial [Chloroflexia bacterium]|nr:glycosyltransferase family 2 protein [Chloroflexia bacterium]
MGARQLSPPPLRARPRVSVIIPSYNGAALLPACLAALRAQTFQDFEVLVVDDHSADDTVRQVAAYPEVRLLRLRRNRRFAGAANTGLHAARGALLALLNNDTAADPGWLAALVAALDRHPWADFAAAKLVLFDDPGRLHSAGDYYGADGVPGSRGVWQRDQGQYDREEEVFGACGGAALYRRAMLAALAGGDPAPTASLPPVFDQALTMYCEDVDLNLRARLQGYRCVYVPTARVRHMLSASGGGVLASYYCGRNFLYLLAKMVPGPVLRRNAGRILAAQARFAREALRHSREP